MLALIHVLRLSLCNQILVGDHLENARIAVIIVLILSSCLSMGLVVLLSSLILLLCVFYLACVLVLL